MNKFTKKSLSLAVAALIAVTSSFSGNIVTKANTEITANDTTATTTTEAPAMTPYPTEEPQGDDFKVIFNPQPKSWTNVYAYAYYTETVNKTTYIREPLGRWPGTKLDANSSVSFKAKAPVEKVISDTRIIFTDVDAAKSDLTTLIYDQNGDTFYYKTTIKAQLPVDDQDSETEDGYIVKKGETTIGGTQATTTPATTPVAPTTPVATTPTPVIPTTGDMVAQFDAPADWTCVYAYAYYVDAANKKQEPLGMWPGEKLSKGADGKYTTSAFSSTTGQARMIFVNVDEKNSKMTKDDILVNDKGESYYAKVAETARLPKDDGNEKTEDGLVLANGLNAVTKTGTITVTPLNPTTTAPATTAPCSTAPASTAPASTAPATPAVTPSEIPMNTPAVTSTPVVSTTPVVTNTPAVSTTPAITPVPSTPSVIVPSPSSPAIDVEKPVTITGSISFNKEGKTAGETIKIKASAKDGQGSYKYTYYVTKNGTRKTLAKNTTKTAVNWQPTSAGKYTIQVVIKDSKGNKTTVKSTYKVKAKVITIKSFKTNKKTGQKVNSKIKLTAKATTKSGKVSYKFIVKNSDGDKFTLKGYSKKSSVTWEPGEKGTYTIYLYVKNGKGVTVTKTKKFVIK